MQLTVKDVARLFQQPERTILNWIGELDLPACRVNGQFRFNRIELLDWAAERKISVSPELLREAGSDLGELPSLSDALAAGGVFYDLEGTDKDAVLQTLVQKLRLPEQVDRDFLYQVLSAREALGSTGVGEGIAIPHARNPIVLNVTDPTVNLCFLKQPIDFGALDGLPVQTLFTLISPTVRMHVHLLSSLAFILHNAQFRSALTRQAGPDEILVLARRAEAGLKRPAGAN